MVSNDVWNVILDATVARWCRAVVVLVVVEGERIILACHLRPLIDVPVSKGTAILVRIGGRGGER